MKTKSTHAQVASLIKKELKDKFPGHVFRVCSRVFAGGDSVEVTYNPPLKRADLLPILDKYQYGNFNPMNDSYESKQDRPAWPQVKYVLAQKEWKNDQ